MENAPCYTLIMDRIRARSLSKAFTIWGFILLVWAFYRVYFRFPEWIDDLLIKPIVFLGLPFYYVVFKEKRTLATVGLLKKNVIRDLYIGLGFGMLFAVEGIVANVIKYGQLAVNSETSMVGASLFLLVFLSLAAAFSEEVLVRGFLYTRLKEGYKSEFKAMIVSSAMYFMLLVPAVFTISHLTGVPLLIFIYSNIVLSFANTMIFNETKTITIPIFIHAFWNVAIALFL